MYLKYYCLSKAPFGITPDPAFFYLSASHKEALASLLYGIEKRKGFICVTGEVGCGKTTVLKALLSRVSTDCVKTVYLYNPELTFEELMGAVFEELGLELPAGGVAGSVRFLHAHLIELYQQGKHVVLIVDEAQRMPVETLERLRILSNLETAKDKLLQIVLCGQPELGDVLAGRALRQLRDRIAVRSEIRPLTGEESVAYVRHRLGRVTYGATPVFEAGALRLIVRHARGNPRRINILCDNALVAGYADQKKPVTAKVVREAAAGLEPKKGVARAVKWAAAACLAVLIGAAVGSAFFGGLVDRVLDSRVEGGIEARAPAPDIESGELAVAAPEEKPAPAVAAVEFAGPSSADMELTQQRVVLDGGGAAAVSAAGEVSAAGGEVSAVANDVVEMQVVQAGDTSMEPPLGTDRVVEMEVVQAGDTLSRLLVRVYGRSSRDLIERTLKSNPQIKDANKIQAGEKIVFEGASG
jgi:general secretion pathway protein A